jgi:hypothetical protein
MKDDGGGYVRNYYGVPAAVGTRVTMNGNPGVIAGFESAYVTVRFDGSEHGIPCHPTWEMIYHTKGGDAMETAIAEATLQEAYVDGKEIVVRETICGLSMDRLGEGPVNGRWPVILVVGSGGLRPWYSQELDVRFASGSVEIFEPNR